MKLPYNPKDKKSVVAYAKLLENKTLRQICGDEILVHNFSGKGNFGQVIEKFYFGYEPNSKSEADFFEIGMELKTSPLKQLKNKEYRSKERLVLNIINFLEIVNQEFETSDFWKKNANILLIFYLHQAKGNLIDFVIKLVDEWNFPLTDLEIIKRDWEYIKQKINDGKAHELSEGDTFYLGACTKGANSKSKRKQPNSEIPAKQRAFSLKQGYVNHIIATIAGESEVAYGKLINTVEEVKHKSIEEIVIEKFQKHYGKNLDEISEFTNVKINYSSKSSFSRFTNAILEIELDKKIEEFEKAEIEIKAIRIDLNGNIEQSVSFPAFEFDKIYHEDWLTSDLKYRIEKKFLFVFYKNDGKTYKLEKAKFWNMNLEDRNEVRKVWLLTKRIIQSGNIFKGYSIGKNGLPRNSKKGNKIMNNNLPKMKDNRVCHVRPHGTDSNDTYPLPVEDKILKVKKYPKQCFWFKNTYVRDNIYKDNIQ